MDQADKTRQIFLVGTIVLAALIIGGLIWAISMEPGGGSNNIDANIVFNDDSNPAKGPADAKVVVRIYSDFQCPACKVADPIVNQIMQEYEGKVRFVWNDLPLTSIHANALGAAVAGRCAQEQDRFWEYGKKLFETQDSWKALPSPSEFFIGLADQLGLQKDNLATCLSQETPKMKVAQDVQEAFSYDLGSTPTFFVNRQKYEGVIDLNTWRQILNSQLAK